MWSELYNIALIQCHCNLVPATTFAAFHIQLFAFPYAFQFEQGDQHSPSQIKLVQDNILMGNSAIVSPSHGLNCVIIFRGTFFSFEVGDENHQVYDHR